ncbi:MAG: response regulator [Bacteroidota bacterium]|nr:response regulator [Bacteroidota bacterium]MDP4230686.1 response regulator [Bacteroidota bacterium]MDP4235085.1 response regulator [Bacteroidota bacterium]
MPAHLKITLIDDDPALCEMVKDSLTKKFPSSGITIYHTGEDALSDMSEPPDVVILDYQLDTVKVDAMNGIQVLQKLKEGYPDLPVIFLSSQDRMEVAANTIKYGAHDYIVKNETAFQKLEIGIKNIAVLKKLQKSHGFQKSMSTVVWFLLIALIGYVIYLRFS